jgi:SulP family sulfate permease
MRSGERDIADIRYFPDLDHGLQWCEDQILSGEAGDPSPGAESLEKHLMHAFADHRTVERLKGYMERLCVSAGEYLIRQGDPAEDLFFVERGEFSVQLEVAGEETIRLRTMRAGTVFGEIALYLDVPRSVSVLSTEPSVYYRLSDEALKAMQKRDPDLALAFQDYVIRLLSDRLVDLNRTIRDLSR